MLYCTHLSTLGYIIYYIYAIDSYLCLLTAKVAN